MAMQAQKLHFKCFLDEELLNWLQIARVCVYECTLQCKQKHKRDGGESLNCSNTVVHYSYC